MLHNAKSSCLTTHLLPRFTIYNDRKIDDEYYCYWLIAIMFSCRIWELILSFLSTHHFKCIEYRQLQHDSSY